MSLLVAEHFELSDTGRQRRANEDAFLARSPMFVVADGMGGAQAGEVASRIAVEVFAPGLPQAEGADAAARLRERVQEANGRIHAVSRSDREHAGMGTTITAALLDGDEVAIAHVGDSRAYALRDGNLTQLTRDHSLVDELVRTGRLTEEEAADHPQRSIITRALGPEAAVEVDTFGYRGRAGDVLLLCSDGLTTMVGPDEVAEILRGAPTLRDAGERLVAAANAAGGRDNITVVLFRLAEGAAETHGEDRPTTLAPAVRGGAAATAGREPEVVRRRPLPPPRPEPARRRLRGKGIAAALAAIVVVGLVAYGGYLATRGVFFLGTSANGTITIYRGLPYDGPFGLELYSRFYESGVPAADLSPERRRALLDHKLRSRGDAEDLVNQLERGTIAQERAKG
ncbi:MAG: Stp1/IreP family PP2C-type Ser/Thr phosphatase [Solirubrobacteraceae bacterium]